ncbi:MAG TPA: CBS and ACT domain-containing protein [Anaerolineales bacterium]
MLVRDYMTKNPITVSPDTSFPEAMNVMRKQKIRRLPVVDRGRLVGIVEEKDMLSNKPSPATTLSIHEIYGLLEHLHIRQIMSRPVITVEGDCPVEEAARIMVERKIGCLPIMDGDKLAGIITETDIFKLLVEVLGGQDASYRLTLSVPEKVGELAKISSLVAEQGGNLVSVVSSRVLENQSREVMIKVTGIAADKLQEIVAKRGIEILDLRPSARYQPRLFE